MMSLRLVVLFAVAGITLCSGVITDYRLQTANATLKSAFEVDKFKQALADANSNCTMDATTANGAIVSSGYVITFSNSKTDCTMVDKAKLQTQLTTQGLGSIMYLVSAGCSDSSWGNCVDSGDVSISCTDSACTCSSGDKSSECCQKDSTFKCKTSLTTTRDMYEYKVETKSDTDHVITHKEWNDAAQTDFKTAVSEASKTLGLGGCDNDEIKAHGDYNNDKWTIDFESEDSLSCSTTLHKFLVSQSSLEEKLSDKGFGKVTDFGTTSSSATSIFIGAVALVLTVLML